MCAGVSALKRTHSAVESADVEAQLHTTTTLLFSLLVLGEAESGGSSADDNGLIGAWMAQTLEQSMLKQEHSSWGALLRSGSEVCGAALREARRASDANALEVVGQLAVVFFSCSVAAMVESALQKAADDSGGFLSLDAAGILEQVNDVPEDRIRAIVGAAESDAGQMLLRDLVLSFRLPRSVLGLRRTLLLSRETTARATREFTSEVNMAHETAMAGAEAAWRGDQVQRTCALLAGLAIILAPNPEALRKGTAFEGRVSLPFLECSPQQHTAPRLALLPEKDEWVVYRVSQDARVTVSARYTGVEGLCRAVLLVCKRK
jgi:hypothetical protein